MNLKANNKNLSKIKEMIDSYGNLQSTDRAAVCAFDLIDGLIVGEFDERLKAWERDFSERAMGHGGTETTRNGKWVPAIPL